MADYFIAPVGNDNDPGTQTLPWKTLAKAASVLQPGDTLWVREGAYSDAHFHSLRGGTAVAPITIRRFGSEVPRFTGAPLHGCVFDFNGATHGFYVFEGLTFEDLDADAIASPLGASALVFRGCTFRRVRSAMTLVGGSGHLFEDCLFDECGNLADPVAHNWNAVTIRGSTRVMVRRCRFSRVERYGLELLAGGVDGPVPTECIIEDNVFENTIGGALALRHGTHRCVVQRNTFRIIGTGKDAEDFALVLGGPDNIIRNNLFLYSGVREDTELAFSPFRDQDLVRIDGTVVDGIAQRASNNRLVHNVFYKAGRAAVSIVHGLECESDTDSRGRIAEARNNLVLNNIFYACSVRVAKELRGTGELGNFYIWFSSRGADGTNEWTSYFGGNVFRFNIIRHADATGEHPGEDPIIGHEGDVVQPTPSNAWSLAEVQSQLPAAFSDNLDVFPAFLDPFADDFRLNPVSPALDAGGPLTRTTAAAPGPTPLIPVEDPYFFADGFLGLSAGDSIRLGNGQTGRIVGMNLTEKWIFLDRDVTFANGETVHYDYAFAGPDIGRFELGLDDGAPPPPPPPPTIQEPLFQDDAVVLGTGLPGAVVEVFVNGQSASVGNIVDSLGMWEALLNVVLIAGDTVFARQTVSGVTSGNSNVVTVQGDAEPPPEPPPAAVGFWAWVLAFSLLAQGDQPPPPPPPTSLALTPPLLLLLVGAGTGPQIPWDNAVAEVYSGRGIGRGILRGVGR